MRIVTPTQTHLRERRLRLASLFMCFIQWLTSKKCECSLEPEQETRSHISQANDSYVALSSIAFSRWKQNYCRTNRSASASTWEGSPDPKSLLLGSYWVLRDTFTQNEWRGLDNHILQEVEPHQNSCGFVCSWLAAWPIYCKNCLIKLLSLCHLTHTDNTYQTCSL